MGRGTSWFHALVRDSTGRRRAWAAPVPWIAGMVALATLGVSALFGGLAPVEATVPTGDETTVVDAGITTIGVEKALIVDDAEEVNLTLAPDEELLLLRLRVTSTFDEPVHASSVFALTVEPDPLGIPADEVAEKAQLVRIPGLATRPSLLMRLDTAEFQSIVLQPGVPTVIAIGFVIPDGYDADDITVQVERVTTFQFTFLGDGEQHGYQSDGVAAAITLPVERDE